MNKSDNLLKEFFSIINNYTDKPPTKEELNEILKDPRFEHFFKRLVRTKNVHKGFKKLQDALKGGLVPEIL